MLSKPHPGMVVLLLLMSTGLSAHEAVKHRTAPETSAHHGHRHIHHHARDNHFESMPQFLFSWGIPGSDDGEFDEPHGIAFNSAGEVYVADMANNRMQKFSATGDFMGQWRSASNSADSFSIPLGVAVDSQDAVYLADSGNDRIVKFTNDGEYVTQWGTTGSAAGEFNKPSEIAIDSEDNLYITDEENHRVQKFTSSGQFVAQWGSYGTGEGEFSLPEGIAVDSRDYIYVTEFGGDRIQKFSKDGVFVTTWGQSGSAPGEFSGPNGIAIDAAGRVLVVEEGNERGQVFTSDGKFLGTWGELGSGDGQFLGVRRAEVNQFNQLYVSEIGNQRIQVFSLSDISPHHQSPVGGLRADVYSSTAAEVFWDRSDVANARYRVYVNGSLQGEIEGTSWFSNSFAGGRDTEVAVTVISPEGIESEPASITFYNPPVVSNAGMNSCLIDNLRVVLYSTTAIELFWNREPGSPMYEIFLDDEFLVSTRGVSWFMGNLEPGSQHEMKVVPAESGCSVEGLTVSFTMPEL